jgi:NAD(P)-dependent dehydrogenase (short-subunit alcohol dehydrogenase family)
MGLLDGKVAVITGAGGGLGRAHALLFAKEGAKVVVNDLGGARDGSGAGAHNMADVVVGEIRAAGGQAVANYDSVATMQGGQNILKTALDAFGQVDILINNAGILRDKTLMKMDEADWDLVLSVHLRGTFCVTKPIFTHMRERGKGGVIVNTSSTSGLCGNFGQTNYGAAKAGIAGFRARSTGSASGASRRSRSRG